jgi:hypothetical protein
VILITRTETEIAHVIHLLTQSPPSTQLATLNKYFTPSSSFIHPFVRTGSWSQGDGWNSRWVISRIYRWYKILSPVIKLNVHSVAFDKTNNILYVSITQTFRIFALIPLGYKANVGLVTKLRLSHVETGKYYIQEQEDLYQTTEFTKFLWGGIFLVVIAFQYFSLVACILLSYVGLPVSLIEERLQIGDLKAERSDDWVGEGFSEESRRKVLHANGRLE